MESHDFENDIGLRVLQNAYQNHPGTNVYHYLIKGQIKTNKIIIIEHKNITKFRMIHCIFSSRNFKQNVFIQYSCHDKRSV